MLPNDVIKTYSDETLNIMINDIFDFETTGIIKIDSLVKEATLEVKKITNCYNIDFTIRLILHEGAMRWNANYNSNK